MKFKRYFIGDSTISWRVEGEISREISAVILKLYRMINNSEIKKELNIHDIVPSYNAIGLHFDPAQASIERIIEKSENIIKNEILNRDIEKEILNRDISKFGEVSEKKHIIPVSYNGEDLKRVADLNKITEKDVVKIHTEPEYTVAMVGFLPHFPYLIGLNKRIETPRLDNPRTKVPKGSVAIGGAQTGIYPSDSPGGWNLIGNCDSSLLIDIKPGDSVEFKEI